MSEFYLIWAVEDHRKVAIRKIEIVFSHPISHNLDDAR